MPLLHINYNVSDLLLKLACWYKGWNWLSHWGGCGEHQEADQSNSQRGGKVETILAADLSCYLYDSWMFDMYIRRCFYVLQL